MLKFLVSCLLFIDNAQVIMIDGFVFLIQCWHDVDALCNSCQNMRMMYDLSAWNLSENHSNIVKYQFLKLQQKFGDETDWNDPYLFWN